MKIITLLLILLINLKGFSQNPEQKIQDYLLQNREKLGLTSQDISDFVIESTANSESTGIFNYYVKQRYQGIELFQSLSNFWIKNGQVINGGENFISNVASKVSTTIPTVNIVDGFSSALRALNEVPITNIIVLENKGHDYKLSNGKLAKDVVRAELVYHLTTNGFLKLAWDYNFYSQDYKHLWSVRMDALDGTLLEKDDLVLTCSFGPTENHSTHNHSKVDYSALLADSFSKNFFKQTKSLEVQSGSYRVLPLNIESPNHGSRQLVASPHNITASPFGWHDENGIAGAEYTNTQGNNVYAQEDFDANNTTFGGSPDGGASLLFDFPYGGTGVDAFTYVDASNTNLFYMNNIMHDVYYQYGFNELNGAFQTNNYGRGAPITDSNPGNDDAVIADTQDASGVNNANFSTPIDGGPGRMQMFLWNRPSQSTLVINSPSAIAGSYIVTGNSFTNGNVPLPETPGGIIENLVVFNDGIGDTSDACTNAVNAAALSGKIAVIRRGGGCDFSPKVLRAQNAGAVAVIIVNNVAGSLNMGGSGSSSITIPAVGIAQDIGELLISYIQDGPVNGKLSGPPFFVNSDSSFDNGIVAHEYGHGISNRLAGGRNANNCLNNVEQMGEGWSDWFWLMLQIKPSDNGTEMKGIGTFNSGQPTNGVGIRYRPYSTDTSINDITFDSRLDATNITIPHGIGSIWATMLWDLTWAYIQKYGFDPNIYTGNGGNNKVMRLVLDGLKLQPCRPTFVQGRDALIAADQASTGGQDYCMIWRVFAARGLGVNADSATNTDARDGQSSYDEPAPGPNCTTLGINYFSNEDMIRVFPNPSNGDITIRINQFTGKVNLQVIDLNGRVVYSLNNTDFSIEKNLNLNQLQKGMYIIKIDGDNLQYTKKIILN